MSADLVPADSQEALVGLDDLAHGKPELLDGLRGRDQARQVVEEQAVGVQEHGAHLDVRLGRTEHFLGWVGPLEELHTHDR